MSQKLPNPAPATARPRYPSISGDAIADTVNISLTREQAQALHWLLRHLAFEDALQSTPPHLGKDVRTERAYGIVRAASAVEEQIADAGQHGDKWMYNGVRP